MRENLGGVVVRLGVFLAVCLLTAFLLIAVFGEVRFGDGKTYYAEFANVSNLRTGKLVRIAGVEVGKVTRISINPDATVRVQFTADNSVTLTRGTRAVIRYDNLFGDRYLALEEGAGGLAVLRPGHTIPLARTQPALDLDALIGGFKPLFRALNPEQVNALSEQLLHAFAGQGPTIGSLLAQSAAVTNTLADRDRLIGQVITNLNVVLGSLGAHTDRLDQAVTSLSALIHRLAQRKTDISNAVAYTNAAAGSVADLLSQARAPLAKVVRETDRVAGIAAADHDYLDNLLNTLPDKYQALVRQGFRVQRARHAQDQRGHFLQAARQCALNLTTIDWRNAEADVRRILDGATGEFYNDFAQRSQPFVEVLRHAKASTVGTITEAGLQTQTADTAQALVAVSVQTSNAGEADPVPRAWRMRITVQRVGDRVKVSDVGFVP